MKRILIMLTVLLLVGCRANSRVTPEPARGIEEASSGVAGVQAHNQSAEAAVVAAKPHVKPAGAPYLETASNEHAEVAKAADTIDAALSLARDERHAALQTALAQGARADAAESFWGYRWGQWMVMWKRRLVIGWSIFVILALVLKLGNPFEMTGGILRTVIKWAWLAAKYLILSVVPGAAIGHVIGGAIQHARKNGKPAVETTVESTIVM